MLTKFRKKFDVYSFPLIWLYKETKLFVINVYIFQIVFLCTNKCLFENFETFLKQLLLLL